MQLTRPKHCSAAAQELGADARVLKEGRKTVGLTLPSQNVMAHLGEWVVKHESGQVESYTDVEFRSTFHQFAP
jgi:hypothetical protein